MCLLSENERKCVSQLQGNGAVAQETPWFRTTVNKVFFAERLDDQV